MTLRRTCVLEHPDPYQTADRCELCRQYCTDPLYRAAWDQAEAEAAGQPVPRPVRLPRCPHLWKRVRDEQGRVVQKVCVTCPSKPQLDVFECRCPSRRQLGGNNDKITFYDCQACQYRPRLVAGDARKYILVNHLSPGDVLCMTAALYSLHRANPGKFRIAVDTTAPAFWEHNPDVEPLEQATAEGFERAQTHYPLIHQSNQRAVHVLQGYCEFLADNLRVKCPLLTNRPHVYLSPEERSWTHQVEEVSGYKGKFWLLGAGRKQDYTSKFWGSENYQALVNQLRGRVQFVQVGAAEHHHPPLRNVINLTGKTDLRQLTRLVYHAQGCVGGTTLLMHLAAALERPYVCLLGGREPVTWNAYPKSHILHTIGSLPCCAAGACWKSRTVKLDDDAEQNNSLCESPVLGDEPLPKCLLLIKPEEVAAVILRLTTA
jgi:ADP-heptose:LPS heptosyltransferase